VLPASSAAEHASPGPRCGTDSNANDPAASAHLPSARERPAAVLEWSNDSQIFRRLRSLQLICNKRRRLLLNSARANEAAERSNSGLSPFRPAWFSSARISSARILLRLVLLSGPASRLRSLPSARPIYSDRCSRSSTATRRFAAGEHDRRLRLNCRSQLNRDARSTRSPAHSLSKNR
jgi:hypothetical protein